MTTLRKLCGPTFVGMGILHFAVPGPFEAIVPRYLPAPKLLVQASGVTELAGGIGLMVPATRRYAGWLLLATLAGVYPANIDMALHPERFPKIPGGRRTLIARLPLQFAFAAWVRDAMRQP
jgi:uncharacterized membrane protein